MNLQLNAEVVLVVLNGFFIDNTEVPAAQETPCSSRDGSCLQHKVILKGSGHAEEEEKKTRSFFPAFHSGINLTYCSRHLILLHRSLLLLTFESQNANFQTSKHSYLSGK